MAQAESGSGRSWFRVAVAPVLPGACSATRNAEGAARTTDGGRPLRAVLSDGGQEALAFSLSGLAAAWAGAGAGLAAS